MLSPLQFIFLTTMPCALLPTGVPSCPQTPPAVDIGADFYPVGYMGCIEQIDLQTTARDTARPDSTCMWIQFTNSCAAGWAGLYWTNEADPTGANWGQFQGKNFAGAGYTRITFWAKGSRGGEAVTFGTGGINNVGTDPRFGYRDALPATYSTSGRRVRLTTAWQQFTIDLTHADLSSVVGGFFWSADWRDNPAGLTFFLDDVRLQ